MDRASEIRMPPEGTSNDGFSQLPFLGADARECVWYRRQRIYLRASGINCGSGDSICFLKFNRSIIFILIQKLESA